MRANALAWSNDIPIEEFDRLYNATKRPRRSSETEKKLILLTVPANYEQASQEDRDAFDDRKRELKELRERNRALQREEEAREELERDQKRKQDAAAREERKSATNPEGLTRVEILRKELRRKKEKMAALPRPKPNLDGLDAGLLKDFGRNPGRPPNLKDKPGNDTRPCPCRCCPGCRGGNGHV